MAWNRLPFAISISLLSLTGTCLPALANGNRTTGNKGAQVYCYMRSNGNDHEVSFNASYALVKRQGQGMFKTSPQHAAVMITEAVVAEPGNFPDCGKYLGDLFGGSSRKHSPIYQSNADSTSITDQSTELNSYSSSSDSDQRYSY